jgi:hypothetical protein
MATRGHWTFKVNGPLVLAGLDLRDDMISSRPSALPTHQLVCVLADVRPHRAQAALANVDANK